MFAVIRTGGKQFKIEPGSVLEIEKIPGAPGDTISLEDVLLVADGDKIEVGRPQVEGAKITAEIVSQGLGKKQIIFKKKRRQGYRLKKGHRQPLTKIRVDSINL